jgi:hypothetical protein
MKPKTSYIKIRGFFVGGKIEMHLFVYLLPDFPIPKECFMIISPLIILTFLKNRQLHVRISRR